MWRHLLNETAGNLWRHREGNLLSLATISASLFTFSLFLLLITNLGAVIGRWSEQIQVSVFLADEADSRTTETLTRILRAAPEAESFEFVSKEEALERFRADFSRLGQLTGSLEENPLPASFEVRVAAGFRTPEAVAALLFDPSLECFCRYAAASPTCQPNGRDFSRGNELVRERPADTEHVSYFTDPVKRFVHHIHLGTLAFPGTM